MDRLILSVVFLLAGFGAFVLSGLDTLSAKAAEQQLARHSAQLASPPGSTAERKSTTAPTAARTTQAAPAPAPATPPQAKPQADKPGPGWAVNCTSGAQQAELQCRMSQRVVVKQTGKVLANIAFRIPVDTKTPEIVVQLPLGLNLQAGATFQVDENTPQRISFKACDRRGCYGNTPVTPEVLATLRKGKQLKIVFQNLAEKPITVPLSLDGFADAYDKMQKSS